MNASQREYSGETDLKAMIALAHSSPADNLHVLDLPYRLSSWALDDPGNVGLWVDAEGELLAWAVMQAPFWTVDCVCQPQAEKNLYRQILAWADQRACTSGRPAWYFNVFARQADRIDVLEEAGFVSQANVGEDSWSKVLLQRPAQVPVTGSTLPAGFTIRPLAGEKEVEAYVQLHRTVFESKNMTAEWRARTLLRPEYISDLDLVAAAADGSLAAFCIGWLSRDHESKPCGQIEPLGVHPDFRKLGLGRAILSEVLQRLSRLGAERVFVETDRHRNAALELYEAAGFRPYQDILVYRKDY
ncbi:MAG: GNAT family N-acetyltransferase [Omnitrophica WOR_2 bacterium]